MILDAAGWPVIWAAQQRAYEAQRRAWNEAAREANPEMNLAPLPQRRSSKRKPIPGTLCLAVEDEG